MAVNASGLRHFEQVSFIRRSKDIVRVLQMAQGLALEGVGAGGVRTPYSKMHFMLTRRTIVDADVRVIIFL